MKFNKDILKINPEKEVDQLCVFIDNHLNETYRRKGITVGLSGGIDSAVMAALAVKTAGKDRVTGLIMPDRESSPESRKFAEKHADQLGIETKIIDISNTVDSVEGYSRRDQYIKKLVPEFEPGCKYNISLPPDLLERDSFSFYVLQVELPNGQIVKKRLSLDGFRTLTAFASIKIRSRMLNLYWHAEHTNSIVAGTTNRTEMILGDFCKYGDGGTDIEPLAKHYKNQIYQMADYLDVIPEIIERKPSPDTFSLPVSDQEFFFRIPFEVLDHLLYAWENKITEQETADVLELPVESVKRAFRDFSTKNKSTAHLRQLPFAP